jgi:hypothetical protein
MAMPRVLVRFHPSLEEEERRVSLLEGMKEGRIYGHETQRADGATVYEVSK